MNLVIIESPLGSKPDGTRCTPEELNENVIYARACLRDSLLRGEAPFASHVIYPLVLDDATPAQRRTGMDAGLAWGAAAARATIGQKQGAIAAVYLDRGITIDMREGIAQHRKLGLHIEYRRLGGGWAT